MLYLAIVAWNGSNRLTKYQDFITEADAAAHVVRVFDNFPDAFVAPHPGGFLEDWLIDPVAKTLSISQSVERLAEFKKAKRDEFRIEAVARMAAQVSAWNSFERIEFLLSISNMLDTSSMTAAQTLAKDILLYTKNTAIPKVNTTINQAALDIIDPTAADPFGDGTLWPT